MGTFRVFGTTADEGIEVEAEHLEEIFSTAVEGFVAVLLGRPETVIPREAREVEVEGEDEGELLVALLNELIYLFDAHRWVPRRTKKVLLSPNRLRVRLEGEPFDPSRHPPPVEVKAATYHGVDVSQKGKGWHARLIFDL